MTPSILALILVTPLIHLLIAVLVALIIIYCVGLFISDAKILTVVRLIIGLLLLVYGLQLFGLIS